MAEGLGVLHERNHKGKGAATGYPDDKFYIAGGRPWIVEFKRPGERPKKRQLYIIGQLQEAGYDVSVIDRIDTFCTEFLQRVGAV